MSDDAKELKGPDLSAEGVDVAALAPGKPFVGHAGGENVLVVRVGDDVLAISASCTHYGAPLEEGLVDGDTIRCPWHHACFSLRTGRAIGAPALADASCFETRRDGGLVKVHAKPKTPPPSDKKIVAPRSVVIVGGGAAGTACVEMLRKEGYSGPITLVGTETPVDRPNLSKDYLAGKAEAAWMPLGTKEHWENELRVELATSAATAIDTDLHHVTLDDGRSVPYGALLIATGSEPVVLDIPGHDLPHVHTLRTLADADAIIDAAKTKKTAVVLGASFIGLEAAASLVQRGMEVHVVAPDPIPLAKVFGDQLGKHVMNLHVSKGVHFHLGTTPKAITDKEVLLANGEKLAADLVVMGVGVKPRLALAEATGLALDHGVIVDHQLRTSAPDVWAAGDIARYDDPYSGDRVRIEHWQVAERQGEHVARSMLGIAPSYRDVPFFWTAHYDFAIHTMGHAETFDEAKVYGSFETNDAAVAYRKGGKTLAVATVNRDYQSLEIEKAFEEGPEAVDRILER